MIDLGLVSFASPWMLTAALALPVIWLLLRMTPPAVTRIAFPALLLLRTLKPTERTPARTPWWLVLLRMVIAALVIVGLAEPVLNAQRLADTGPVVVVIDDTWAAARRWPERLTAARDIIAGADLRGRPVVLIATAARPAQDPAPPLALADAREALSRLTQLEPKPWGADLGAALKGVQTLTLGGAEAFWISAGIDEPGRAELTQALQRLGRLSVIADPRADGVVALGQPQRTAGSGGTSKIELGVRRFTPAAQRPDWGVGVRALDAAGAVLAETTATLAGGASSATASFVLPSELANRIARFEVAGLASAAGTALADDRWQQRPVGVFSAAAEGTTAPLLEDGFYLQQALGDGAEVRVGSVRDLLARPLSMLIVSGGQRLTAAEADSVGTWVENGGLLVRFAGPRLDPAGDALLPVKLRLAGRNLGGALSWGQPAGLGPFPENSPFRRLPIPDDVKVTTQILAEPSPDLPDKTWARLSDGTPLITAARRGAGWIVLFHVTATPEWSNLPLSGLFIGMLQTLLDLSQGVTGEDAAAPDVLPALSLVDGFGRLAPPGPLSAPLRTAALAAATAGPDSPPGLYGTARAKAALNLGPALASASAIESWLAGVSTVSLEMLKGERDLRPWLLTAALLMLLADFALSFALRGLMPRLAPRATGGATAAAALGLLGLLTVWPGATHAADGQRDKPLDPDMVEAVLQTRLAYVVTGSSELDRVAESGLAALTRVLAARTSAEMGKPAAIDLNKAAREPDVLMPYPLIYWRVAPDQPMPPSAAISAINEYFRHGGMMVFDAPNNVGALGTGDGGSASGRLRDILALLDLPPLMPLKDDHVLTRSFYLLPGLPGRYANGTLYVERGSSANDGVSSVIVGGHDWAAAWARDAAGLPLYPVVPGGEQQREAAYRSGVNMVMYALTGNYKADQVHLPAIMQRLTQ